MPLTKVQVKEVIDLFKTFDVKKIDLTESFSKDRIKYHRFGAYNGLEVACTLVKLLEENIDEKIDTEVQK